MKEYFSHDYHARSELASIQMNHGLEGLGFYWCFVEMLHEREGSISESSLPSIAYELHADVNMCKTIINDYGLFVVENGTITCDRVLRNLKKRKSISEARRNAGRAGSEARWNHGEDDDPHEPLPETSGEPKRAAEEPASCGVGGFTDASEKESLRENAEWWKTWVDGKFTEFEEKSEGEEDWQDHPCWHCRGIYTNLVEEVFHYQSIRVSGHLVKTSEYMNTIKWFLLTKTTLECLSDVLREVDSKASEGKIKNKQNYLIAALYQAAKMHGG